MNKIFTFLLIGIAFLFWSNKCDKPKKQIKSDKMNVLNAIIDTTYDFTAYQDKFSLKKVELKDSLLTLTIEANVCNDDLIELVFNGNYLKSYPPKAQIGLKFIENNQCKNNTLIRTFNINPIKYPNSKTTIFLLKGIDPIIYNY